MSRVIGLFFLFYCCIVSLFFILSSKNADYADIPDASALIARQKKNNNIYMKHLIKHPN